MFRGSKGPILKQLSLQQLRRPLHIHTPLVSANAVVMWCMECIWTSNRMRLMNRAHVCMGSEVFFPYRVFGSCFSLMVARLSGWQQVRAALYECIHCGPSGRCLVRIASMDSGPDLTCAVRGACVPWIPSALAAVFPCTIAAPRQPTLLYPDRTNRTLPACLPLHHAHPPLCVPDLTYSIYLCLCLSVIVG